jgi:FAD synthetase
MSTMKGAEKKMKKVLAFGTFDIFHPGHEAYLKEARRFGDFLQVVVARDATVEKVKGALPMNTEEKRLAAIQSLEYVDKAVLGSTGDKYSIIEELRPDVICLGYDQKSFTAGLQRELKKRGIAAQIVRIQTAYMPEKYKSSILRSQAGSGNGS